MIAEGVDRWAQLDALLALGCRQAQGPLFAPPVVAAEVARFLHGEGFDVSQHDRLAETDELPTLRFMGR